MRPDGFYWVWYNRAWWVAKCLDGRFWLPGHDDPYTEADFERITAPLTEPPSGYDPKDT